MSKGRRIKDDIRKIIGEVYIQSKKSHPDWIAEDIRDAVEAKLQRKNRSYTPGWPGLSAVQKEIAKINDKTEEIREKGQDEPWTLDCLEKYDLPAEAIPLLLDIQKEITGGVNPLTIRIAFWVSKLRCVLEPSRVTLRLPIHTPAYILYQWAWIYATEQLISETTSTPFDTSKLDRMIIKYPEEYAFVPIFWEGAETQEDFDERGNQISKLFDAFDSLDKLYDKYPESRRMPFSDYEEKVSKKDKALFIEKNKYIKDILRKEVEIPSIDRFFSDEATRLRIELYYPTIASQLKQQKSQSAKTDSEDRKQGGIS